MAADLRYSEVDTRRARGGWNWNQVAIGLALGIVVSGGSMLAFQRADTPPEPQPSAPATHPAAMPSAAAEAAAEALRVEEDRSAREDEAADEEPASTTKAPRRPLVKTTRKATRDAHARDDTLNEEERALLARMGGGGRDLSRLSRADQEAASTGGGPALTASQLTSVVQSNKQGLTRCYETALRSVGGKQDDTLKIKVSVTVGASGAVKNVQTQGRGIANMSDCIRRSVNRWRFPKSGGDSEFEFPLVFQPGA